MKKSLMTVSYILMLIFLYSHPLDGQAGPPEEGIESENGVFKGMVVRVIDGDSVVIRVNRENRMIALYGIDCPENSQAYGNAARYWVTMLVFHEEVRVKPIPPDNYRETPALIYFGDDRCLNQELVMAGLAWVEERSCQQPECIRWLEGENKARNTGVGLWKEKAPTPPWKWREMQSR
ncbi:MAG: thermonuclease family protein [Deltaproteobacteria bacterium]|nr:thermonuclease family protein [Deltaproteobacteria bacterium]